MPQSQMPYGDRTAAVRCQILQNRTAAVRSPYDFYGHRTVAVAFLHIVRCLGRFKRRVILFQGIVLCFSHKQHRTATVRSPYGDRTVTVRSPQDYLCELKSRGHRTVAVRRRTAAVRLSYGHRAILVRINLNIVRRPNGSHTADRTIAA